MHVIHKKNVKFLTICVTRYKTSTIPDHRDKTYAFFQAQPTFPFHSGLQRFSRKASLAATATVCFPLFSFDRSVPNVWPVRSHFVSCFRTESG